MVRAQNMRAARERTRSRQRQVALGVAHEGVVQQTARWVGQLTAAAPQGGLACRPGQAAASAPERPLLLVPADTMMPAAGSPVVGRRCICAMQCI